MEKDKAGESKKRNLPRILVWIDRNSCRKLGHDLDHLVLVKAVRLVSAVKMVKTATPFEVGSKGYEC